MKKAIRRMQLKQETIRALTNTELGQALGGYLAPKPRAVAESTTQNMGACCCSSQCDTKVVCF